MRINFQLPTTNSSFVTPYQTKWDINLKYKDKENLTAEEREMSMYIEQYESDKKSNKLFQIDAKLKNGEVLTEEEKEFLKEHNPDLYEKLKEIEKEREEMKEKLDKADSKEEVEKIKSEEMNEFAAEVKNVGRSSLPVSQKMEAIEQIGRRMQGALDEYNKFTKSEKYSKLPLKEDEEEKKKKGVADIISGNNKNNIQPSNDNLVVEEQPDVDTPAMQKFLKSELTI
ncbi:hypothetical protein AN641_09395 [Candidatus Epulonipiscioides gigas]|nr:hypothetical protein AN641_09395 [Epulopiscium sp. SCG-C07WGA-EpuloA2]